MSSEQFFSYIQDENMFTINQYVGWKRGMDGPMGKQNLNAIGLETRKGEGRDGEFSQCNRSPMDHCYTEFFNVRRGWQSLNTGPQFYLRLIRRTGWLWIHTSRTTDRLPFKPKKLSVPFLYPGVPAGLTPFRGLVPLGRSNLVPILPPAHPLGGGPFCNKSK